MISAEELIRRIKETGVSGDEIERRVNEKMNALSGLISREGALHIITNELKINLYDPARRVKIGELVLGGNGEVIGKIVKMYEVREFRNESDGKVNEGRLVSADIGDETGVIRLVAWRGKVDELAKFNEGDVIRVKDFYVKEKGAKEMHLRDTSVLEKCDEAVEVLGVNKVVGRKPISELNDGDRTGIYGVVVHIFEPRFYDVCGQCNGKVEQEDGKWKCKEHGFEGTKVMPFVTFFLDDGSGNIRMVCFREQVAILLGVDGDEVAQFKDNLAKFEAIKGSVIGKQIVVDGRAVMNKVTNTLEFIANEVGEAKPEELISELEKTGD